MSGDADGSNESGKPHYRVAVGEAVPELDQRLSAELVRVNAEATMGIAPARQLTVQILDGSGELAAGMSGWTWGWPPESA